MPTPSIFARADLETLRRRIAVLTPTSTPVWGTMDVAQMLAHCQVPIRVALGEVKLPRSLLGKFFGWIVRGGALGPRPFGRGLPTSAAFVVKDARDFEKERDGLLEVLTLMSRAGPAGVTKEPHPFFGRMTPAEWDTLQWKHVDHHLRQFGA
jgi:hypothetical protein